MSSTRLLRTFSTASRSAAASHRALNVRNSTNSFTRFFHTTSANMVVHEVKSLKEFQEYLNKTGDDAKPIVLDSSAAWCGPCRVISPILDKFSEIFTNVTFLKFDVDDVPDLSQELGVRAMPTFFFFANGEKVDQVTGANPPALEKALKEISEKYGKK